MESKYVVVKFCSEGGGVRSHQRQALWREVNELKRVTGNLEGPGTDKGMSW